MAKLELKLPMRNYYWPHMAEVEPTMLAWLCMARLQLTYLDKVCASCLWAKEKLTTGLNKASHGQRSAWVEAEAHTLGEAFLDWALYGHGFAWVKAEVCKPSEVFICRTKVSSLVLFFLSLLFLLLFFFFFFSCFSSSFFGVLL